MVGYVVGGVGMLLLLLLCLIPAWMSVKYDQMMKPENM